MPSGKMFSSIWSSYFVVACCICLCFFRLEAASFDVPYCSTLNTADTPKNISIYQSNGLCYDFCKNDYAFAVVQGNGCWCSNYVPESTTTGCTMGCPGYDLEKCGGIRLFGYIDLIREPSGTRGAGGAASSTTQTSSSETDSTETTTSSTWTPTPVVSLQTITGKVQTVTVTPTVPPDSQNLNDLNRDDKGSGGLGTGGAVGLTIGLVALAAIIGATAFFCIKKRRKTQVPEADEKNSRAESLTNQVPSRSLSEHSRYVLGTDGRQVIETWEADTQPPPPNVRNSRLMPVDPRLDPFAPVYQRGDNKSRESVNTLRDDHDYSRRVHRGPVLRATNPDE